MSPHQDGASFVSWEDIPTSLKQKTELDAASVVSDPVTVIWNGKNVEGEVLEATTSSIEELEDGPEDFESSEEEAFETADLDLEHAGVVVGGVQLEDNPQNALAEHNGLGVLDDAGQEAISRHSEAKSAMMMTDETTKKAHFLAPTSECNGDPSVPAAGLTSGIFHEASGVKAAMPSGRIDEDKIHRNPKDHAGKPEIKGMSPDSPWADASFEHMTNDELKKFRKLFPHVLPKDYRANSSDVQEIEHIHTETSTVPQVTSSSWVNAPLDSMNDADFERLIRLFPTNDVDFNGVIRLYPLSVSDSCSTPKPRKRKPARWAMKPKAGLRTDDPLFDRMDARVILQAEKDALKKLCPLATRALCFGIEDEEYHLVDTRPNPTKQDSEMKKDLKKEEEEKDLKKMEELKKKEDLKKKKGDLEKKEYFKKQQALEKKLTQDLIKTFEQDLMNEPHNEPNGKYTDPSIKAALQKQSRGGPHANLRQPAHRALKQENEKAKRPTGHAKAQKADPHMPSKVQPKAAVSKDSSKDHGGDSVKEQQSTKSSGNVDVQPEPISVSDATEMEDTNIKDQDRLAFSAKAARARCAQCASKKSDAWTCFEPGQLTFLIKMYAFALMVRSFRTILGACLKYFGPGWGLILGLLLPACGLYFSGEFGTA